MQEERKKNKKKSNRGTRYTKRRNERRDVEEKNTKTEKEEQAHGRRQRGELCRRKTKNKRRSRGRRYTKRRRRRGKKRKGEEEALGWVRGSGDAAPFAQMTCFKFVVRILFRELLFMVFLAGGRTRAY